MTQQEQRPPAALDEALARLLAPDNLIGDMPPRFPCRPLTARSAERHTAFAVFTGGIGLQCLKDFRAALHDLAGQETNKIILDFSEASLSRTAIGSLVAFAAAMHGNNKRLYLYRPSAQLRAELKKIDLSDFFTVLKKPDDVIFSLEM